MCVSATVCDMIRAVDTACVRPLRRSAAVAVPIGRLITVVWIMSALVLTSGSARALGTAGTVEERQTGVLKSLDNQALTLTWAAVRAQLERGAWREATSSVQKLIEVRTDLGLPSLEPMSSVLLYAAEEAAQGGAQDEALALCEGAAALSDHMSAPYIEMMRHSFDGAPLGIGATVKGLRGAVDRLPTDLRSQLTLLGNGAQAATWLMLLLVLFFALASAIRYARYAASDIRRFLPRGVGQSQAIVLYIAALSLPIILGLGLLPTAACWLAVLSVFQRMPERIAGTILLAGVAMLPGWSGQVHSSIAYPGSPAATLQRCNQGPCSQEEEADIRHWANNHILPYESHFTLALLAKRRAGMGQAGQLERAVHYVTLANGIETTPEGLNLEGNLEYLTALGSCPEGDRDPSPEIRPEIERRMREAVALWKSTYDIAPSALPPLYNSQAVLRQLGDDEVADPLLSLALKRNTMAVTHWNRDIAMDNNLLLCRMIDRGNRHLMDMVLPVSRLRSAARNDSGDSTALLLPYASVFVGSVGADRIGLTGLAGIAGIFFFGFLGWLVRASRDCTRCGGVAEPKSRIEAGSEVVCEACVLSAIRKKLTDAKEQWFAEKRREAAAQRWQQVCRVLTYVLPGLGHLLKGRTIRGLLVIFSVTLATVLLLEGHVVITDPRQPVEHGAGRTLLLGMMLGGTWLLALIDIHAIGGDR
jgi:hypothetical protein